MATKDKNSKKTTERKRPQRTLKEKRERKRAKKAERAAAGAEETARQLGRDDEDGHA